MTFGGGGEGWVGREKPVLCTLLMNKSLSYVNLSLELYVVSIFWLGSDTSGTFSVYFARHIINLRDQPSRCPYFGGELKFVPANFLRKYP